MNSRWSRNQLQIEEEREGTPYRIEQFGSLLQITENCLTYMKINLLIANQSKVIFAA